MREQIATHVYKRASATTASHPRSGYDPGEEDDSLYEPPRMPISARRYHYVPEVVYTEGNTRIHVRHQPPPASRQRDTDETALGRRRRRRTGPHWLLFVGAAMLAMLALWIAGEAAVSWWQLPQDDATYGRPRTFQVDAVVGHGDSPENPSHFLAVNYRRHILIMEMPGGDAAKMKVYLGPVLIGDGQDLTPVTLTFEDVNGDGKPDMLVHIGDQTIVFLNDGAFRPQKPGDTIN
jgi:hypothetical protein